MCRAVLTLLLLSALSFPGAIAAQTTFSISPRVGMYVPIGALAEPYANTDADFRRKHQVGSVMAGVAGAIHWGGTKLEAGVDYAPSLVAWTDASGTRDIAARVILMNLRVGQVFRADETWHIDVAGGGGLISRSGEAWESTGGSLDPALTIAGGASFDVVPGVAFRIGADVYFTKLRYTNDVEPEQRTPFRQDLFFTLGVGIPVK